jgi:hypothetical protein
MLSSNQIIIYKVLPIVIGFIIIYFGYNLFKKGIFSNSGDLTAIWGNKSLLLKKAAPGTFFSLFGMFIVLAGVFKGIEIQTNIKGIQSNDFQKKELPLNFDDSSFQSPIHVMNLDSLFKLGKRRLYEKKHLEALKFFYITKGILSSTKSSDSLMKELDYKIALCEHALTLSLIKTQQPSEVSFPKEETKSININEHIIDSSQ